MSVSDTIRQLLVENLSAVFGERDDTQRQAAIARLFATDCSFPDPRGTHVGHQALNASVAELRAALPDHVFTQIGSVDVVGNCGKLAWGLGSVREPLQITGIDVAIVRNDRIKALYTFLNTPDA